MTDSSIDAELNIRTAGRRRQGAATVLYDVPGPRSRRLTRVASIIASAAALAGLWFWVYQPLAAKGQFSMRRWGPLIDPSHPLFELVWRRIGVGLAATLEAAGLAIVGSLVVGVALAMLRLQLKHLLSRRYRHLPVAVAGALRAVARTLNALTRVCVEVLRGMPVVITIFFAARALPELGVDVSEILWFLVIGLVAYNSVVIAEIVRSGMEGLPKGQREAAASIGLSSAQTTWLILLPQAIRIMLPALISQLVVVVKDTSLGFIISYQDLLGIGNQIILNLQNPLQVYIVIGLIYLALNYTLSRLADWTDRRLARR
jgi:glutamate transport system permease protein